MTKEQLIKQIDEIISLKAKEKFASKKWLIHESNLREKMNIYYKLTKQKEKEEYIKGYKRGLADSKNNVF